MCKVNDDYKLVLAEVISHTHERLNAIHANMRRIGRGSADLMWNEVNKLPPGPARDMAYLGFMVAATSFIHNHVQEPNSAADLLNQMTKERHEHN